MAYPSTGEKKRGGANTTSPREGNQLPPGAPGEDEKAGAAGVGCDRRTEILLANIPDIR